MKILVTVGFCISACAALAGAQTKVSATGKCSAKPEVQQSAEVGDRAGHVLVLTKQACTWTTPMEMAGEKSKTYTVAIASDQAGGKSQDRGYVVVTMENGDKAYVHVQGTSISGKDGAPVSDDGTWSYAGGTGKLKGLKGKGTYKGKAGADGFEDQIEGEYSLPAAK
jgi:hypothetical protein